MQAIIPAADPREFLKNKYITFMYLQRPGLATTSFMTNAPMTKIITKDVCVGFIVIVVSYFLKHFLYGYTFIC